MTAKYGTPYFSNYINSRYGAQRRPLACAAGCALTCASCARSPAASSAAARAPARSASSPSTCRALRISATDEADFYKRPRPYDGHCRALAEGQAQCHHQAARRGALSLHQALSRSTFDNHFSTIGLVGMNEAVPQRETGSRADHDAPKTSRSSRRDVLNHMRERLSDYQEQYGDLYNLRGHAGREHHPTALPSTTSSSIPISSPPSDEATLRTTPTAPATCRSAYTDDIFSAARHSGRAADALHIRHRIPRIPRREAARLGSSRHPCPQDRRELQAALLHHVARPIPYARTTATSPASSLRCPELRRRAPKFTAVSPATTARCRTGTHGKSPGVSSAKEYNIGTSVLKHKGPLHPEAKPEQEPAVEEELCKNSTGKRKILFTRENCPKLPHRLQLSGQGRL